MSRYGNYVTLSEYTELGETYHPSNREVRANPLFLAILLQVVQRIHARRYQIARLIVVQFLSEPMTHKQ